MSKPDPDNEEWTTYNGELRRRQRDDGKYLLFVGGIVAAVMIGGSALSILWANDWDARCLVTTCVRVKP